ncbi:hypothetical protein OROHE_003269 [Orobanche hederae]
MEKHVKSAALAAWLVPFAAEHIFRTTGQIQSSTSFRKYEQIFRACFAPDVSKYMEADVLYHKALHWISPARVWAVLKEAKDEDRIPEAIRLRMTSAPAGTALITTSRAVLDSMKRMEFYAKMESMNIADFEKIFKVDRLIREDPPGCHIVPSAYGRAALNTDDRKEVEDAKREAKKAALVTKAFVDAMLGKDSLATQQVLNKYAEMNPFLYERCKKFFRSIHKIRCNKKLRKYILALQLYSQRFRFSCHHCDHRPFYGSPTALGSHYKQKHKDLYRHGNKCGCGAFFTDPDGLKSHRALRSIYRCHFGAGESNQTRKERMKSESKKANEDIL